MVNPGSEVVAPSDAARRAAADRRRAAAALGAALLAALTACSAPTWRAVAAPHGTELFVDGLARGTDPITGPIPYYGVVDLAAVPPLEPATRGGSPPLALRTTRVRLEIDEPAPPWLFPFDFFVELAQLPFGEPVAPAALVVATPRAEALRPGEAPPDLDDFVDRARAAIVQRGRR